VEDILDVSKDAVTAVKLKNIKTQQQTTLSCAGVFIAIGHVPSTELFRGQLQMNEAGFLIVQSPTTKTSVPGVFACGDCVDHIYRQAVTAAGTGCSAAIDAERYLAAL